MDVVFAPFIIDPNIKQPLLQGQPGELILFGHFSRMNPIKDILEKGPSKCRIVFNCADGYVTPSVYKKKEINGQVVPTWNFVAAQVIGEMQLISTDEQLKKMLVSEVDCFEQSVGSQWKLLDAPQPYIKKMMANIFGVRVTVKEWKVHKKTHQRDSKEEVQNVTMWLQNYQEQKRTMGYWMQQYLDSLKH